jgi:hypothetical protein
MEITENYGASRLQQFFYLSSVHSCTFAALGSRAERRENGVGRPRGGGHDSLLNMCSWFLSSELLEAGLAYTAAGV